MTDDRVLLDITLDSLPPSKNRRTAINKQTGHLYTSGEARSWMETTMLLVRQAKTRSWQQDQEVSMMVCFYSPWVHRFDLDGALGCRIGAVFAGLLSPTLETKRPPDQWIMHIDASKE